MNFKKWVQTAGYNGTRTIVSRSENKWYKPPRGKKFAFNSQLKTVQISTDDV